MILYALRCDGGHTFEAWFRDAAAYDRQAEAGAVTCPVCESRGVEKAIMAPRLARHHGARSEPSASPPVPDASGPAESLPAGSDSADAGPEQAPVPLTGSPGDGSEPAADLRALRAFVERTCDDVGDRFAEEARRIHYGETDPRAIRGEATADEAESLRDEGIAFASLPWSRRTNA
ncbi:DUF1178 family protein [Roseospira navarrensis]|uniref:DUF1178 family protein n=1 Tax=Roseospira navarrensis TaxID=140058 RepID=A0A7X1ZFZ6_9PROT|nr:DUF1178 family protein [Roseospira navarrensis]MQX36540.1 DUF1178 family protein [Roseospira navarrensis]